MIDKKGHIALLQVALLFVTAIAGSAIVAAAPVSASPTSIDSCTIITEPGEYILINDVQRAEESDSACIEIRSSDVVFDGNGFEIDPPEFGKARLSIGSSSPLSNVTVRDASVQGSISISNVDGALVTNSDAGLHVSNSHDVRIANNSLGGDYSGLSLSDSHNIRVINNSVGSYYQEGGAIVNSNDNTFITNTFYSHHDTGLVVVESQNNVFRNNRITSEDRTGVRFEGAQSNTFVGNSVTGQRGMILNETSSNNTLADMRISDNTLLHYGLIVSSSANTITNTTVGGGTTSTTEVGIWLRNAAANNLIYDNLFTGVVTPVKLNVSSENTWNVTPREGTNVLGGLTVAGNYYADERCLDANNNGVCDNSRPLGTNNVDSHPLASGNAYDVSVDLVPASQQMSMGSSTTYDVVVRHADSGIGSIDASFTIDDNRSSVEVVSVADITVNHVMNEDTVSTTDRGFKASLLDTPEDGSVTIATITLQGEYAGHGELSLDVASIGTEQGETVNVRQPDPVSFDVKGPVTYPPVNEFENGPTDPNDDGEYEDINGDGTANIVDVTALFQNLDDETIRDHPEKFDFNDDDSIDVVDVTRLFYEL